MIWDEVKLAEKAAKDKAVAAGEAAPEGLLDGVPTHLPALMQAQKVSRKAAAVGFEWETVQDVWDEVAEERAEFEAEKPGSPEREMEFGDLLFALVNVARKEGIDAESALRASTAKFRRRWAAMEAAVHEAGDDLAACSTAQLNDLWDQAKASEWSLQAKSHIQRKMCQLCFGIPLELFRVQHVSHPNLLVKARAESVEGDGSVSAWRLNFDGADARLSGGIDIGLGNEEVDFHALLPLLLSALGIKEEPVSIGL